MRRIFKVLLTIAASFAALLVLGGAGLAIDVFSRPPIRGVPSTRHASLSRSDCINCHEPIAEEWRRSFHYRSVNSQRWKDIQDLGYKRYLDAFRKPCLNCHAPANVLDLPRSTSDSADLGVECTPNLLRNAPGVMPALRSDDVALGVDCVACHVSRDGIVGSGMRPTSAHATIADVRFRDARATSTGFCRTCHGAAVAAWKDTGWAAKGVTCLDCHMPEVIAPSVEGGAPHRRRSHAFPADKNPSMLERAVGRTLDVRNNEARLRIVNHAGHFLPSGGNALIVTMRALDLAGRKLREEKTILYKKEGLLLDVWPFDHDTRIASGTAREIAMKIPKGARSVEAAIRYHDWMREEREIALLRKELR